MGEGYHHPRRRVSERPARARGQLRAHPGPRPDGVCVLDGSPPVTPPPASSPARACRRPIGPRRI